MIDDGNGVRPRAGYLGQSRYIFKLCTQICFCFSVPETSSESAKIDVLTIGHERLSKSFPWLAGRVVNEGSAEGNTGTFKIKPFENTPRLIVKDLRHDPSVPTMNTLRGANFPISMLDESTIAPCKTLSTSSHDSVSDFAPVFLIQANLIKGGPLITILGQHNTMGMAGQVHIIRLSKACRHEQFMSEELSSGNFAHCNLVLLLDQEASEFAHQIAKPTSSGPRSNECNSDLVLAPTFNCTWTYFSFSPASLTALKAPATKTMVLTSATFLLTTL